MSALWSLSSDKRTSQDWPEDVNAADSLSMWGYELIAVVAGFTVARSQTGPLLSCHPQRPRRQQCLAVQSGIGVFVSLVTDGLFADRSRLIEISEARTTFGKNLRPQLDRVCAQIGVNGLAVEVAGEFYLQPGLL
jgi:hypothetical protein